MASFDIALDDLVDNPTPRVAVSLCLDCSGSMRGEPIDELNRGVQEFYRSIADDEIARYSAEISIVTFGPEHLEADFKTVDARPNPPVLTASGYTPLGKAVKLSLDILDRRKREYQANGVEYYQPWLVIMTDGRPECDDPAVFNGQVTRIANMVENRKLTVFPIAIGPHADVNALQKLSPAFDALRLQGLKFADFFSWLSKSVSSVSQSIPGEKVPLDKKGIKGWAEL